MPEPVAERVEGGDRVRRDLAVHDDVERQVHQGAQEVGGHERCVRPQRDRREPREELVRVEDQDRAAHASLEVVAEKRARTEIPLPVEDDVVERVIEVDEESTGRDARRERRRAGDVCGRCARGDGRHEMSARAHVIA